MATGPAQSGEYIEYEPDSELRDTENVPLAKTRAARVQRHPRILHPRGAPAR
jgi:hypothetical protein